MAGLFVFLHVHICSPSRYIWVRVCYRFQTALVFGSTLYKNTNILRIHPNLFLFPSIQRLHIDAREMSWPGVTAAAHSPIKFKRTVTFEWEVRKSSDKRSRYLYRAELQTSFSLIKWVAHDDYLVCATTQVLKKWGWPCQSARYQLGSNVEREKSSASISQHPSSLQ